MNAPTNNIFIIFHGRFPSEKAAALFAAENAKALANFASITVVVPDRPSARKKSPYIAYNLPDTVRVVRLPTLDLFGIPNLGPIPFVLSSVIFSCGLLLYLPRHVKKGDYLFTNDLLLAIVSTYISSNVIYEVHDYPEHWKGMYRFLFKRLRLIISTNSWKTKALMEEFSLPAQRIMMERNGVDITNFQPRSKEVARNHVKIPHDVRAVMYTGHLYRWKGVDSLLEVAKNLPDISFYFVGGTVSDVQQYAHNYANFKNVIFTGHVPHGEIPLWQSSADVLVLPNTAREEISAHYTSPMKLFEYMASARPIVASNLPSITEVIDNNCAFLFEPDNVTALQSAIESVFQNPQAADSKARKARQIAESHSWEMRASRILKKTQLI